MTSFPAAMQPAPGEKSAPPLLWSAPAPEKESDENNGDSVRDRVMGLLRDIRAEAQNIRKSIAQVQQKKDLIDRKVRKQELEAEIANMMKAFEYSREKINERLRSLRTLFSKNSDPYNWWGDVVTEIEDDWNKISQMPIKTTTDVDETLDIIGKIDGFLHEIVLLSARNTIPPRVEEHLEELRVGQPLDFNQNFQDELESPQDRQDVLNFIASHPTAIDGMVDVNSGLIYKSGSLRRQLASYALMILLVVVGGASIFLFSYLGSNYGLTNWPVQSSRVGELVVAYFFVFLGSLVHMGVEALKQSRASKNNVPTALGNLFLWFHVKETSEILGILTLWVGFWGLVFTVQKIDWQVAFFVGFSIDSFAELFLQRFTTLASSKTSEITKQLGQTASSVSSI